MCWVLLTGCTPSNTPSSSPSGSASGSASASPSSTPSASSAAALPHLAPQRVLHLRPPRHLRPILRLRPRRTRFPKLVPGTTADLLPGEGKYIAWTVDDGADPEVVRAYAEFARRTGTRLTFFINYQYPAFKQHRDLLLPLVKSTSCRLRTIRIVMRR